MFININTYSKNTRNGFNHYCEISVDGRIIGKGKACYINRTWEAYNYKTVIIKALRDAGLEDMIKDLPGGQYSDLEFIQKRLEEVYNG